MNRRFAILLICLLFPIGLLSSVAVLAEISVGVKEGDWIEYNVTYTGSPPDSYPTWVRIDIQSVQGTSITINVRRELLNGTSDTRQLTFDLETGAEDLIIIPANLNNGDSFYHEAVGNITISGVEDETYAGVKRTVVYATGTQIMLYWDKATGVLVQADQSTAVFTQRWKAEKTNMWMAQIFGLDPNVFYALTIITVIAIVAIVAFFLLRRSR